MARWTHRVSPCCANQTHHEGMWNMLLAPVHALHGTSTATGFQQEQDSLLSRQAEG